MAPKVLNFPLWVYVNKLAHQVGDYPFYLMTRGGYDSPFNTFLPVFSSEEIARNIDTGPAFKLVEMDRETFFEALRGCRIIEDVVLDIGTDANAVYRVEELLE